MQCLNSLTTTAHVRVVKRADIMDTRVPELEKSSSGMATSAGADTASTRDDERAQQAALEQLADRINAARSVV